MAQLGLQQGEGGPIAGDRGAPGRALDEGDELGELGHVTPAPRGSNRLGRDLGRPAPGQAVPGAATADDVAAEALAHLANARRPPLKRTVDLLIRMLRPVS